MTRSATGLVCALILGSTAMIFIVDRAEADNVTWTGGGGNSDWNNGANWNGGAAPGPGDDVTIGAGATVDLVPGTVIVKSLTNNGTIQGKKTVGNPSGEVGIQATGNITNTGTIKGATQNPLGAGAGAGKAGANVNVVAGVGAGVGTLSNSGFILGGDGAGVDGPGPVSGGDGGEVYAGGDDVTNTGTIAGGRGGNADTDDLTHGGATAGKGGGVTVEADDDVTNGGTVKGGAGGDTGAGAGRTPEKGGDRVDNAGGKAIGGNGGKARDEGGAERGSGTDGKAKKEGHEVSMNSGSRIEGSEVELLATTAVWANSLDAGAISADSRITINTCSSGMVDLTGNPTGENVLISPWTRIVSDSLRLDPGVSVAGISDPDATVVPCGQVGVDDDASMLASLPIHLMAPRPNPTRGPVELAFTLAQRGPVTLEIHDVSGRRVAALAGGDHAAGYHRVTWDGALAGGGSVASGVYFAELRAAGRRARRTLLITR